MGPNILVTGPQDARTTIILAHGAGGAMDTKWMEDICQALSRQNVQVLRFEFGYMAARRTTGKRSPPPRANGLLDEYRQIISENGNHRRLVIGGKSMGGRVASMIADDLYQQGAISGLLCLGYPFHPTGKPENLRTAHLATLRTPTLICQGTRDPFGSKDEVASYGLAASITMNWLDDGDHDFKPRKAVSGKTLSENIEAAAQRISSWAAELNDVRKDG